MPLLMPRVRPDDVLPDRCYDDPDLDATRAVVTDLSRPREERAAAAVRTVTARRGRPEQQLLAQEVLADVGHELAEDLRRYASVMPSGADGHDRADALAMAAAAQVRAAWEVRSIATADLVGPDAARTFHVLLEVADDLALDGLRLVPDHPGCALVRVVCGRGRGVPADDSLHRFDVARRREPLCVPAHLQMLQTVCDKWWGSHDAMFDLVRQTLATAPPGHPVTMVLPLAHLEYMAAGERDALARRQRDLQHVRRLSAPLLAGDDRHPRALEAHSAFGWSLASVGEKRDARAHLERARLRPSWLWAYLDDDPRRSFAAVLREVGAAR